LMITLDVHDLHVSACQSDSGRKDALKHQEVTA